MEGSASRERRGCQAGEAKDVEDVALTGAQTEEPPSRPTHPEATRLEGRFELTREVGRGATGVVWGAWDRQTTETVAVKILRGEPFDAGGGARRRVPARGGERERARDPHTVRVVAHGETADGHGFLVMERLSGTTLAAGSGRRRRSRRRAPSG